MRKYIALFSAVILVLCLVGCAETEYDVSIANDYPIVNELKKTYSAGEEVTVILETITEHYYVLSVNGVEHEMDFVASDMVFTYFTFTMPNEDVVIEIEDRWVTIPERQD